MDAIEQLKSVLCDPEGKCCIAGSDEDRAIIDRALQALAQHTEQEPVAWKWRVKNFCDWPNWSVSLKRPADSGHAQYPRTEGYEDIPLYTTPPAQPPQRTWVELTDKVITKVVDSMPRGIKGWMSDWDLYDYARAIEAKLKENT
jgi:hypothetical protein